MSRTKRVWIASASVGTGHNQAARAVARGLAGSDGLDLRVFDTLDFATPWFRRKYAGGYTFTVTRLPWGYGLGFWWTDRPHTSQRSKGEQRRLARERQALAPLLCELQQHKPDLVLCTHFLPATTIGAWRSQGLIDVDLWVLVTDIYAHRWWHCPQADRWFVLQEESAQRLTTWGVDPTSIVVSGMPIHPKWDRPLGEATGLRRQLHLPTKGPIVLLSGGAAFTCGPIARIARRLARADETACVVALAGRNKKLLSQLARMAARRPGRIVPIGYTDRMHEFCEVASLMLTKAGGMMTAECLRKGTGMVFLKPVPGQETGNARFFAEHGAGQLAKSTGQAIRAASDILSDPTRLADMSRNAKVLYRPGRETICDAIVDHVMAADARNEG